MNLQWNEGQRYIDVQQGGGIITRVNASSETGNPAAKKNSSTYRYYDRGKLYRIQIEVSQLVPPEENHEQVS